jgi:phage repressor protein C with HTH and peptisase S24 domain
MEGLEVDRRLVRDLCTWAKLPPSTLAKRAKLAATTLLRPYQGTATTRLSQPTFDKLRAAFPEFPGWRQEEPDQIGMHGDRPDPAVRPGELAYIRQVDISYAMGEGAPVEDYPALALVPFNLDFLRAISPAPSGRLFIASGHGESMEPTLLRSDQLMFDTSQTRVLQQDQIWALTYAGAGMIKRLRRIRNGDQDEYLILSDNPSVPEQRARFDDVHVVGKLVWVGRRMM